MATATFRSRSISAATTRPCWSGGGTSIPDAYWAAISPRPPFSRDPETTTPRIRGVVAFGTKCGSGEVRAHRLVAIEREGACPPLAGTSAAPAHVVAGVRIARHLDAGAFAEGHLAVGHRRGPGLVRAAADAIRIPSRAVLDAPFTRRGDGPRPGSHLLHRGTHRVVLVRHEIAGGALAGAVSGPLVEHVAVLVRCRRGDHGETGPGGDLRAAGRAAVEPATADHAVGRGRRSDGRRAPALEGGGDILIAASRQGARIGLSGAGASPLVEDESGCGIGLDRDSG